MVVRHLEKKTVKNSILQWLNFTCPVLSGVLEYGHGL